MIRKVQKIGKRAIKKGKKQHQRYTLCVRFNRVFHGKIFDGITKSKDKENQQKWDKSEVTKKAIKNDERRRQKRD